MKRRFLCMMLALALVAACLSGCGAPAEPEEPAPVKIGISLPNNTDTQRVEDGKIMSDALTAAGYEVELQYAGDDPAAQVSQLQALLEGGCQTLIVAAVDPAGLSDLFYYTAEDAAEAGDGQAAGSQEAPEAEPTYDGTPATDGVNVIAYDTLITGCNAIDYYVGFDGYEAGYLQACYLERQLALYDAAEGDSYTIELFFDSKDALKAEFQYAGAMEVLQMYIDSGVLRVASGQTSLEDCTMDTQSQAAQRMEQILSASYQDTNLDAILCADDTLAQTVCDTLYASYTGSIFPLITGMGCEEWSVNALLTGQQSMTLLMDCTGMAQEAASAAMTLASGGTMDTQDSLDNGTINIPASLFYPQEVYADNYQQMLIDRGYFSLGEDGTITAQTDYFAGSGEAADEPTEPAESSAVEEASASVSGSAQE